MTTFYNVAESDNSCEAVHNGEIVSPREIVNNTVVCVKVGTGEKVAIPLNECDIQGVDPHDAVYGVDVEQ